MGKSWSANMTIDRHAAYEAAKAAFDAYKPTSFDHSFGQILGDQFTKNEGQIPAYFALPEGGDEVINAKILNSPRTTTVTLESTRPQAIQEIQSNAAQIVAKLANALINQQIGSVDDVQPARGKDAIVEQQQALDGLFGFPPDIMGGNGKASAEALAVTKLMSEAIKQNIAAQTSAQAEISQP